MLHESFTHIGGDAEGRHMRAHQAAEIDQDGGNGKGHSHPSVVGDAAIIAGNHIAKDSPNIEERRERQKLADAGNH